MRGGSSGRAARLGGFSELLCCPHWHEHGSDGARTAFISGYSVSLSVTRDSKGEVKTGTEYKQLLTMGIWEFLCYPSILQFEKFLLKSK